MDKNSAPVTNKHFMNLSKKHITIVAVVFAVLGAYFVWHSSASARVVATIQAEQMTITNDDQVISDVNAVSGSAVILKGNSTISGTVNLPSAADTLTIRAREDTCRGDASFTVAIDGTKVGSVTTNSRSWTNYSFSKSIGAGSHSLAISFTNDYLIRRRCDRNLYIDQAVFYGNEAPKPIPTLTLSATPNAVAAGSSSTLTWASTNVSSCTASGNWSGNQATSGTFSTGSLSQNALYSLTCSGTYGTVSANTAVSVTQAPATPTTAGPSFGINTCCGGTTEENRILATGLKLIRTDRGNYEIAFAHQHNIKVDGIVWLDPNSAGAAADILELDNEPYYNNWNGLGGPVQWAQKARDTAKALKAAYPNKPILLPLLGNTNNGDVLVNGSWQPLVNVINQAAPDIWQYVDGMAIHPYTRPNAPSYSVIDRVRTQLKTIGTKADKPFWVTEMGWPTGGTDGSGVSEALQAQYTGQFIDTMRARADVASIIVYKVSDDPPSSSSESYYGLFRYDGTQKPSFNTVFTRK